jgi:uncharacterized linocin/CFP29 family protein
MGDRMIGDFGALAASGAPTNFAATLWAHKFNVESAFRAHTPLDTNAQKLLDQTVISEFKSRLQVTRRLLANGQVYRLQRPFAYSEVSYHIEKDTVGAKVARTPIARAEYDLTDRTEVKTPIYYTFADFQISLPELETSRNQQLPLDTNLIRQKARDIAEAIEEAVIRGQIGSTALPKVGGNSAAGLENAPSVNTVALSGGLAWDNASKTVDQVLTDVKGMIAQLDTDNAFGPVDLFIPVSWMNAIRFLRNTTTDRTAIELLEMQKRGGQPIYIAEADKLSANTAVMYLRSSLVMDVVLGDFGGSQASDDPSAPDTNPVPITTIPWNSHGGMMFNWKLISCVIPRSKRTYGTKSGIVKLS